MAQWPRRRAALAVHDGVIGLLHAVPALVAVHRVVAPADRADRPTPISCIFASALLHEAQAALRRRVAPVGEGVVDRRAHALLLRQSSRAKRCVPVAVHAARPQQAEQVQRRAALAHMVAGGHQLGFS